MQGIGFERPSMLRKGQGGRPIGTTELPPPPPLPTGDPPPRSSYARLLVLGLIGAIGCSGIAVVVALQLAKADIHEEGSVGTPAPSDGPEAPTAVEGLRAEKGKWTGDPDSWRISLTWQPVEGAAGYLISRDGRRLIEADATEFIDHTVTPEGRYRYEVVAFDAERTMSKASRVQIRTGQLPKAVARVQGKWLLKLEVRSSSIGVSGGGVPVTFTPTCRQGPCSVGWSFDDVGNKGIARSDGATYEGSGSGAFLTLDCHGGVVSATVTLEFHVKKAHTVRKTWRATEISGTLTEFVPSVSNCLSARNVWTFQGSAQG
jgi:hypothetical protein